MNSPGPNRPCPCGSGTKYKKCCGAGLETRAAEPVPLEVLVGHRAAAQHGSGTVVAAFMRRAIGDGTFAGDPNGLRFAAAYGNMLLSQQAAVFELMSLIRALESRIGAATERDFWTLLGEDREAEQFAGMLGLGLAGRVALTEFVSSFVEEYEGCDGFRRLLKVSDQAITPEKSIELLEDKEVIARHFLFQIRKALGAVDAGDPPLWPEEDWAEMFQEEIEDFQASSPPYSPSTTAGGPG